MSYLVTLGPISTQIFHPILTSLPSLASLTSAVRHTLPRPGVSAIYATGTESALLLYTRSVCQCCRDKPKEVEMVIQNSSHSPVRPQPVFCVDPNFNFCLEFFDLIFPLIDF